MYGEFFNIDEGAFSIAPNPNYLFLSAQHQEVLAHLIYGVTRSGGFVLITGEIGTGKTTVCRSLFTEIPSNTDIALIVNPKLEPVDLLASVCDELDVGYPDNTTSAKVYLAQLNGRLIDSHAQGKNTILIIDEAQNLSVDALETIRGLTNLETDEQKLLQIILIGQPELRDRLNTPELEQLNQRITARFHLQALSRDEVTAYIMHRLTVGNADANTFSKSNIDCIYKLTSGVPRLINVLCDRALLGAYVQKEKRITNEIIENAAIEALGKGKTQYGFSRSLIWVVLATLLLSVSAFLILDRHEEEAAVPTPASRQADPILSEEPQQVARLKEDHAQATNDEDANNEKRVAGTDEPELPEDALLEGDANVDAIDSNSSSKSNSAEMLAKNNTVADLTPKQWVYRALLERWGLSYTRSNAAPCDYVESLKLLCYSGNASVALIQRLNRPVLLHNTLENGAISHLLVTHQIQDVVYVADQAGEYTTSWDEIAQSWQGDFTVVWRPISALVFIKPGVQGAFIQRLDKQLAQIFNRSPAWPPLDRYENSLAQEVKLFQRSQSIPADGVVGPLTQIFINNIVRNDVPKLR